MTTLCFDIGFVCRLLYLAHGWIEMGARVDGIGDHVGYGLLTFWVLAGIGSLGRAVIAIVRGTWRRVGSVVESLM